MPITKEKEWNECVENNKDAYGKCCVDVARQVMKILDDEPGDFDPHTIICRADDETKAGGITGFMAGMVSSIVSQCHSRGEEFRHKWNKDVQIGNEGDKANEEGGVLNPALLNVEEK